MQSLLVQGPPLEDTMLALTLQQQQAGRQQQGKTMKLPAAGIINLK